MDDSCLDLETNSLALSWGSQPQSLVLSSLRCSRNLQPRRKPCLLPPFPSRAIVRVGRFPRMMRVRFRRKQCCTYRSCSFDQRRRKLPLSNAWLISRTAPPPLFHHWLTPAQIGELYGPDPAAADALRTWLLSQGFRVDSVAPSGLFLQISGTAGTAETAFQTSLHQYRIGTPLNPRVYRAAVAEPLLPVALASYVGAIQGLTELPIDPPRSQGIAPAVGVRPLQTLGIGHALRRSRRFCHHLRSESALQLRLQRQRFPGRDHRAFAGESERHQHV